jgi:hypothetical protein
MYKHKLDTDILETPNPKEKGQRVRERRKRRKKKRHRRIPGMRVQLFQQSISGPGAMRLYGLKRETRRVSQV